MRMCVPLTNFFLYLRDLKWPKMLMDKRTYLDISEKTGASTATISRVNRSLNYGNDGYDMVFKRMEEKKEQNRSLDQKDE